MRSLRNRFAILVLFIAGIGYPFAMHGASFSSETKHSEHTDGSMRERLVRHVAMLADSIGERHIWRPEALSQAARYIEYTLADLGYQVSRHRYHTNDTEVANLEIELIGATNPEEIIVLGAHYDSVIESPGANDNGTGVAGLLEIARLLADKRPERSLRLVAFVNEEPPFFQTDQMGSRVYARRCRERGENIVAMISLETIGYYSNDEGSQKYPFPFSRFYPNTANFIGVVGNLSSRSLVRTVKTAFQDHCDFPCESAAVPGWITGVGWSDHWAFWEAGYSAVMVTDTALFRYPYYHTREDTIDKVDFDNLARVVVGLAGVAAELAGVAREED